MNKMSRIVSKTHSGAQNDMDALEVGNGGMSDDEYLTHFSIWALEATPMIIGTDLRQLSAKSLSIYTNPAVIAVSQDPTVTAGQRHWRYFVDDKDEFGQGEISMWTRVMNNSDVVIAFVNAGNNSRRMSTTLAEAFRDEGGAMSDEASLNWDVYDLWGYRMDTEMANMILNGTAPEIDNTNSTNRWNATEMSYEEGLAMNATALMGKKIGSVAAMGTVDADVPRHGTALLRLRSTGMGSTRKRDEL